MTQLLSGIFAQERRDITRTLQVFRLSETRHRGQVDWRGVRGRGSDLEPECDKPCQVISPHASRSSGSRSRMTCDGGRRDQISTVVSNPKIQERTKRSLTRVSAVAMYPGEMQLTRIFF